MSVGQKVGTNKTASDCPVECFWQKKNTHTHTKFIHMMLMRCFPRFRGQRNYLKQERLMERCWD